jgi:class 3 adenylate cyclase
MDFYEVLEQVIALLQRHGRVSYRALKRQFHLDEDYLEDLKEAILYAYAQVIVDGRGFVWRDDAPLLHADRRNETEAERRFHALLPGVIALLRQERRVTFRTLKYIFRLDETFLDDVRRELRFRRLALDENGEGLVWTGEESPAGPFGAAPPRPPAPPPEAVVVTSPASSVSSLPVTKTAPLHDGAAALPEPVHHASDAERRQLTVLFCDLVGSTQLSGQLDPEDLRTVVRTYQEAAAEVVQLYEGHIAQYLGDGLLVYFGYPTAHEDDARRAVYTGLYIVQALATLNTRLAAQYGVELAVRLGIHTGPVVVGQMGGGGRHEHLALGETPIIAARLETLAPTNTVVISAVTARLVRGAFALEELGMHTLHGVADPMAISCVRGLLAAPSHGEEFVTATVPVLVGREEESGLLRRRWDQS